MLQRPRRPPCRSSAPRPTLRRRHPALGLRCSSEEEVRGGLEGTVGLRVPGRDGDGAGCVPGCWTAADLSAGAGTPQGWQWAPMLRFGERTRVEGEAEGVGSEDAGLGVTSLLVRQVTPPTHTLARVIAPGRKPRWTFKSQRSPYWTGFWRRTRQQTVLEPPAL